MIVVDKAKFESANVGDVLDITVSEVSGGYPQVIVCVPSVGTDLENGLHLDAAGTGKVTITGDMLKVAKAKGLQFKGDGMTITKIALESDVYPGRPSDAIWVGQESTINSISRAHLNFAGLAAGDIIKCNYSEKGDWTQLLPSQTSDSDYTWGTAYSLPKTEGENCVMFTITDDVISNKYNVILQSGSDASGLNKAYTFTSVQIIKEDLTEPVEIWSGSQEFKSWTGFSIPAAKFSNAKPGNLLRFTITELYDVESTSWSGGAQILVKNGDGWADLSPKFESERIANTTEVPLTYGMPLTQAVIDIAQINGLVIQGMGFTVTKIEIVPTVSTTISDYGWATFSSTSALDFSDVSGLTAYIVTGNSGKTLTTEEVTGAVPEGTGLLLKGTKGTTYQIPAAASASAVSGNKLVAVTTETTVSQATSPAANYVLSSDGTDAVFKQINSTPATVAAGKAYLHLESAPAAPQLSIFGDDGETTGISGVQVEKAVKGEVYDLQGRRVQNPTKGLYIVGGKKVVVK